MKAITHDYIKSITIVIVCVICLKQPYYNNCSHILTIIISYYCNAMLNIWPRASSWSPPSRRRRPSRRPGRGPLGGTTRRTLLVWYGLKYFLRHYLHNTAVCYVAALSIIVEETMFFTSAVRQVVPPETSTAASWTSWSPSSSIRLYLYQYDHYKQFISLTVILTLVLLISLIFLIIWLLTLIVVVVVVIIVIVVLPHAGDGLLVPPRREAAEAGRRRQPQHCALVLPVGADLQWHYLSSAAWPV